MIDLHLSKVKLEVILKPCPWCKKTPEILMPIAEETWCWKVFCSNSDCKMRPQSPHVSIRNSSQTILERFLRKVDELCESWNYGKDYKEYEKKVIDISKLEFDR